MNFHKQVSLFLVLVFSGIMVVAQTGGQAVYGFLNTPVSARAGAMGGDQIAIKDDDANLGILAPSLLNAEMSEQLSLSYVNYFAGINFGYAGYTRDYGKLGTFSAGIKYFNYGEFTETDVAGNVTGKFSGGDYALIMGWGKSIDSAFSVGANLKPVYSSFYDLNSFGLMADISGTYDNKEKNFTGTVLIKNIGAQIKPYTAGNREPVPFEIQAGASKQLQHMPLRFSIIATNLQKWNLTYSDTTETDNSNPLLEEENDDSPGFFDNLMRHFLFNAEFYPTPNFNFRVGFNYRRRQELSLEQRPGMIGFSIGLGIRVSKFHLSYGRSQYHLAGASNHFTLSTKLSEFYSKN